MNVRQLREALEAYPDELEILIAADGEGNDFSPLYEIATSLISKAEAENWGYSLVHPDDEHTYDRADLEPRLVFWP